jgi:hypothetical protein
MSAQPKLSRRKVLLTAGVSAGALLTGSFVFRPRRKPVAPPPAPEPPQSEIEKQLRRELPYLKHDDETIRRFAEQWERLTYPASTNLVPAYLLSTDFFLNGEDESRPPIFVAFYDPYVSPCYNPLAQLPAREENAHTPTTDLR